MIDTMLMRSFRSLAALLAVLLVTFVACAGANPAPTTGPADFPVKLIQLSGDGAALGTQHGQQLGDVITQLHDKYLGRLLPTESRRFAARAAANLFERHLLPEHQAEVRALAAATHVSESDTMLGQCFLDAMPMTACSTVTLPADASPDHVARFGRNLDFMSFGIADKSSVLLVYKPKGRYSFAAVTWPGMIGVLSGMNEHGLALANMEVTRGVRLPGAMPYVMLYRTVLEQCKTVDEAVALLDRTPRQTTNNLMLMDASGSRAVVEITPQKIAVRRGKDGASLVCTNHQRGADDYDTPGKCDRFDCLHDTTKSNWGKIDVPMIESMLAKVSDPGFTMQSMVFEPSNRVLYLSVGKDAAHGQFHKLDLTPYFGKSTD
jgi:isopenicillin-N N-acyltransferase-like protein